MLATDSEKDKDKDKDEDKEKVKEKENAAILDEQKKSFWLLVTTMLETWLFSGLMYGWPSLVLMLTQEGFYADECQDVQPFTSLVRSRRNDSLVLPPGTSNFKNRVAILDDLFIPKPEFAPNGANFPHDCADRDRKLHAFYTMGIFLLCSTVAPANFIVSKFGVKSTRVVAVTLVGLSLIILAVITPDQADAIFVSVVTNSLGGSMILITSFPVAKLFDHLRLSIACFLLGLHAASGSVFPMMKALYDAGIPRCYLMLALAAITPLVIFNVLVRARPSQESASHASGTQETKDTWVHCDTDTKNTTTTWSPSPDENQAELDFLTQRSPSEDRMDHLGYGRATVIPFHRVLFTPLCMWTFVTSSITKLHLFLFMGTVALGQNRQQYEEGAVYAPIFGILQLGCVATTLMVAIVLERNNSVPVEQRTTAMSYLQNESREQRIQNFQMHAWVFLAINTILVLFDTLLAAHVGYLQIFTFLCHVFVRGALTASLWSLYSCSFFRAHFWTLLGLEALISGVITFLQHPIVVICQAWPASTCYWVTVALWLSTLLGYALPWHIRRYCRSLSEWDKASKVQKMSAR